MRYTKLIAPVLALTMMGTTSAIFGQGYGQQGYGPPPPPRDGYGQQGYGPQQSPREGYGRGGWDAPPQEMREVMRQGFHDGIVGAQRDLENRRRPNVNNRDEFRHPNVPGNVRRDYKEGFRRGYDVGIRHGGPGGFGPQQRPY